MITSRLVLAAALLASAAPAIAQHGGTTAPAAGRLHYGTWGVDLTARDAAIKPGDDFWRYANNGWFQRTPIPADRTVFGLWQILGDEIETQIRDIVEHPGDNPVAQQAASFYASWMDEAGIEARGAAVLRPYLDRIDAVRDRSGLLALFATPGYASPISVNIGPGPDDPTRLLAFVGQDGLGMPNRDYYLREGPQYDGYRAAYRTYIITLYRLAGIADPEAKADAIIALEHRIAEAQWTPERSRDVTQTNNPMDRARLAALAPQFDWEHSLAARGLGNVPTVIVGETTAVAAIGTMLDDVPLDTWKAWLAFHFLDDSATYLPHAFDQAAFEFHGRALSGQQQQRDRWKRGVSLVNRTLGEAVGQIYVQRHFPAESRRQMTELVANLRAALGERLRANQWMDEATRTQALAKLDAFDPRLGSPVHFIDYSPIRVERADLLGNVMRAAEFRWNLEVSRLPNPVDRSLWDMNAQTINAYYSPPTNQITFPAGILQPPFFDPSADPAVNYGAIGAVIGHEIGHGFDDQGRRYDGSGRLRDWWTETVAQRFQERVARLGAQYDAFEPLPGLHVNGALTMGENIGDLGGIEMAYAAYHRYVAAHGEPRVIDGLTGDQRFFLAYAQVWRTQMREGALRQRVLTNEHSPYEYRVNGVVRNVDAWYRAFNIQPGDRLYLPPEQRVHIW